MQKCFELNLDYGFDKKGTQANCFCMLEENCYRHQKQDIDIKVQYFFGYAFLSSRKDEMLPVAGSFFYSNFEGGQIDNISCNVYRKQFNERPLGFSLNKIEPMLFAGMTFDLLDEDIFAPAVAWTSSIKNIEKTALVAENIEKAKQIVSNLTGANKYIYDKSERQKEMFINNFEILTFNKERK